MMNGSRSSRLISREAMLLSSQEKALAIDENDKFKVLHTRTKHWNALNATAKSERKNIQMRTF